MVCVPCFMIPFLLFLWRFIQPYVLMLWNPQKKDEEGNVVGKDENYCPSALMCPCAVKNKTDSTECKKPLEEKKVE